MSKVVVELEIGDVVSLYGAFNPLRDYVGRFVVEEVKTMGKNVMVRLKDRFGWCAVDRCVVFPYPLEPWMKDLFIGDNKALQERVEKLKNSVEEKSRNEAKFHSMIQTARQLRDSATTPKNVENICKQFLDRCERFGITGR